MYQASPRGEIQNNTRAIQSPAQVRLDKSWILFAECEIIYKGRAASTLKKGNYLIIRKSDGSLLIHANTLCTPRNYQSYGAILKLNNNSLVSIKDDETIEIIIYRILNYNELNDWSSDKINITKTEKELQDKLFIELQDKLQITIIEKYKEFITPVGVIDILAIDNNNIRHVIEIKRKNVTIQAVYQLQRYIDYFDTINYKTKKYLGGTSISPNAMELAKQKEINFILLNHD